MCIRLHTTEPLPSPDFTPYLCPRHSRCSRYPGLLSVPAATKFRASGFAPSLEHSSIDFCSPFSFRTQLSLVKEPSLLSNLALNVPSRSPSHYPDLFSLKDNLKLSWLISLFSVFLRLALSILFTPRLQTDLSKKKLLNKWHACMNKQVGGRALSHFLSFRITLYPVPPHSPQAREQIGQKTTRVTAPQPASCYGSAMPEGAGRK